LLLVTRRDPDAPVAVGKLRQDFLDRIGDHADHIPPLRERPEDVEAVSQRACSMATLSLH